jgi:hypothetical protein
MMHFVIISLAKIRSVFQRARGGAFSTVTTVNVKVVARPVRIASSSITWHFALKAGDTARIISLPSASVVTGYFMMDSSTLSMSSGNAAIGPSSVNVLISDNESP